MDNGIITAGISLLSVIIGGFIVAISAQSIAQRRIQMDNVTQERAKWRNKIRSLVPKVHKAIMMEDIDCRKRELQRYQNIFRTLLNPYDCADNKIIKAIGCTYISQTDSEIQAKKFGKRVSRLLKHDWERAKEEVKHPIFQWWKPKRQGKKHKRSILVCQRSKFKCPLIGCFSRKNFQFRSCKLACFVAIAIAIAIIISLCICDLNLGGN